MLHDMLGFLNAMSKYFHVQRLPISKCARQNIICLLRGVRSLKSIGPVVRKPGELPGFALLLMLLFLLLLTYPLSMVLVEMVPALNSTSFLLVMLKYVVGTSHHLFVPLGILVIRADLRGIVVDIYRWKLQKRRGIKILFPLFKIQKRPGVQIRFPLFRKGGTNQSKSFEMTMEEMQRELGLGVDCG